MFSYSTGYYVSPPVDQYLKFKNRCSLMSIYYSAPICADTVLLLYMRLLCFYTVHTLIGFIYLSLYRVYIFVIKVFIDALTVFIYSQIFASGEQSICLSYRLKFIGLIFQLSIHFLGNTNGYTLVPLTSACSTCQREKV